MTFNGIPFHPLFVHFGVCLMVLFALLQLVMVVSTKARVRVGVFLPIMGIFTALMALITKQTGEMLGEVTTDVNWRPHGELGDLAAGATLALYAVSILYWLGSEKISGAYNPRLVQAPARFLSGGVVRTLIVVAAVVASLATLVLTFMAGHTGAGLVWTN